MILLDGKQIAAEIHKELASDVASLNAKGIVPHIALLLVGDNPASLSYVRAKSRACEKVGIRSTVVHLPESTTEHEISRLIEQWNSDESVHGILVQLPLPPHIEASRVLQIISPMKDVDGFHPVNVGRLALGLPALVPCTPAGIVELLRRYQIRVAGKHVVIVGRSTIVGKPLANLLVQKAPWADAVVTVCHSAASDLQRYTLDADVLVVAVGRAEMICGNDVRPGTIVVDVGINRLTDPTAPNGYRIVGDVEFRSVAQKAAALTPVPGGVGPMTIAMLLRNTVTIAEGKAWEKPLFH